MAIANWARVPPATSLITTSGRQAAAEGISVFVATGDSGSPSCDQGGDSIGYPYSAQYGLSVNGIASTPYNTAVGGTDFSWCKPVYNSAGTAITGCPTSSTTQGSPAYWNTSNNGTTGASAAGYVPEIPWNDTCLNPIWASYIQSLAPLVVQATGASAPTNPEAACNYVQNNWYAINQQQINAGYAPFILATYVDTVGGSGGASNCVVNDGSNTSSCSTSITSTGGSFGSIPLHNDGWVKPPWQTGIAGIPNDGVRDIPDVSFFSGDGSLQSATLICVSALGSCVTSGQLASPTTQPTAQEVGGTSVATPQMAGVMALINQKTGAAQGLASPGLYSLAARQTYSQCSAESVTTSTSCYFNDIDQGTISMPCDNGATIGGTTFNSSTQQWQSSTTYPGIVSPNCAALNSGDQVGTLVSSGTTPAYNGAAGFDLATGLGSLNVANVVNAWVSTAGPNTATLTLNAAPTTITINQAVTVTASVTGNFGTATGTVTVTGDGYSSGIVDLSSGSATINIPANSLAAGADTLTVYYSGDSNYARTSNSVNVTVDVMTPTVSVSAPSAANYANALNVSVSVAGPTGSVAIPTGTVSLSGGGYASRSHCPLSRQRHHHHPSQQARRRQRYSHRDLQRRRQLRRQHRNDHSQHRHHSPRASNHRRNPGNDHRKLRPAPGRNGHLDRLWPHTHRHSHAQSRQLHLTGHGTHRRRCHLHHPRQQSPRRISHAHPHL